MRILYLMPAPVSKGPLGPDELMRRRHLLRQGASAAFEWEVGDTDEGPFTIESLADEERCIPGMLRAVVAAERNGFSAIILGCFADPGIGLARSALRIPVIGPAEASLHVACMLGKSFGILTVSEEVVPLIHKVVRKTGFDDRMAGVRTIATTVLQIADNREAMLQSLIKAGELALSTDRADVLVLGCMTLAFLNIATELGKRLRAPVVCPLAAAVGCTEMLLRAGLTQARRTTAESPIVLHSAVH